MHWEGWQWARSSPETGVFQHCRSKLVVWFSHRRERIDELEDTVAEEKSVEFRGDAKEIENLFVGGVPVAKGIASDKQSRVNLNRLVLGNPEPGIEKSDIESMVESPI